MEGLPNGSITRLAPTPSGFLHVGNALNFLLTQAMANAIGARVLLRIDDLDQARVRPEYVEDIFSSLEWLGIRWDIGPSGPAELAERWSQKHRLPHYHALLSDLRAQRLLYACRCTRSMVGPGRYPGHCRHLGLDLDKQGMVWRLAVPDAAVVEIPGWPKPCTVDLVEAMGDVVLRQRDGSPAYQVASLADDALLGVDLVVRGEDLLPSTACQLWMAHVLGMESFSRATFVHHGLITDEHGDKLSKSAGATSLRAMRLSGADPGPLREQALAMLEAMAGRAAAS